MIVPEKMGIVKLSLIFRGNNSINIAPNAPKSITIGGSVLLINNTIPNEIIKPAKEPDIVFLPILPNGYSLPTIAANESPIAKNINAGTATIISKEYVVIVQPESSQVAPVKSPFDSFSLSIDPNQ